MQARHSRLPAKQAMRRGRCRLRKICMEIRKS
jgi:hypothetical protein